MQSLSILASNNLNYFSPVELSSKAIQKEVVYSTLRNFSKDNQEHIKKYWVTVAHVWFINIINHN